MTSPSFPDGFLPVQTKGFGGFAGPVAAGEDDKGAVFLFDIAAQHLNGDDRLHGGMMMSLMAIVMGETTQRAAAARDASAVTRPLSLNCDFVSAGEPGERVEGRAIVTRATRSVMFMSGTLTVGERVLMTATGVYAVKAGDK
jgi:acyl-coenzyme A thioesterase PaaI-like protein